MTKIRIDVSKWHNKKTDKPRNICPCQICGDVESELTEDLLCGCCQEIVDTPDNRVWLSRQAKRWSAHYAAVWMKRATFAEMVEG